MGGCAAVGCTNSSKKGFLMKRLPKYPARRMEWFVKTTRDNWKPSDDSRLCEVHFAAKMWEKTRVDGTRKLKAYAVPTIFVFEPLITPKRKPSSTQMAPSPKKKKTLSSLILDDVPIVPEVMEEILSTTKVIDVNHRPPQQSPCARADCNARLVRYEKLYFKEKKTEKYKKLLRNVTNQLKTNQEHTVKTAKQYPLLRQLLNDVYFFVII